MDADDESGNWGNVRFRRNRLSHAGASERDPHTYFVIGLIVFLLVALAYPWYSYQVTTMLVERDLKAAVNEAGRVMRGEMAKLDAANQAAQARQQATARQRRLASIRVRGSSGAGNQPVVLVDFGTAKPGESHDVVCRLTRDWLDRDVSGMTLRIQRYRGNQPAISVGEITC